MSGHGDDVIERAVREIAIISTIMIRLAKSAVIMGETIEGPELMWLAEQLDKAVEKTKMRN
jgi:hypothetical protein